MDIVVVGHLSRDLLITPELTRETLGGGSAYAMLAPSLEALNPAIVTKVGSDFDEEYLQILHASGLNIQGLRTEGPVTTRFVNEYDSEGSRLQRVESLAPPITNDDFPKDTREAKAFHFCPLSSEEIPSDVFQSVSSTDALISLDAQGFLRRVEEGSVTATKWRDAHSILQHIDVLKVDLNELKTLSDIDDEKNAAMSLLDMGPELIMVTQDKMGSTIYTESETVDIPLILANQVVDTTGSGDTYSIGFLIEYLRTGDIRRSGLFGATCASYNLENVGPYNMPTRQQVESRMSNLL